MTQKSVPHIKLFCSLSGQFDKAYGMPFYVAAYKITRIDWFLSRPVFWRHFVRLLRRMCKIGGYAVNHRHLR